MLNIKKKKKTYKEAIIHAMMQNHATIPIQLTRSITLTAALSYLALISSAKAYDYKNAHINA